MILILFANPHCSNQSILLPYLQFSLSQNQQHLLSSQILSILTGIQLIEISTFNCLTVLTVLYSLLSSISIT